MRIPTIRGVIDRRILLNYRVSPEAIARHLPKPFRPKLVRGHAVAGICLIRLRGLRPKSLPFSLGATSENAAHRIAVEWRDERGRHEGVYIPRRDTNSRLNAMAGGRIFPGVHHHARFEVDENQGHFCIRVQSDDGATHIDIDAHVEHVFPSESIFRSLDEVSEFFERGSLGYSATARNDQFDGLELKCTEWKVTPMVVDRVASSFFDDPIQFPLGSVEFDHALLMRGIDHEWIGHGRSRLA